MDAGPADTWPQLCGCRSCFGRGEETQGRNSFRLKPPANFKPDDNQLAAAANGSECVSRRFRLAQSPGAPRHPAKPGSRAWCRWHPYAPLYRARPLASTSKRQASASGTSMFKTRRMTSGFSADVRAAHSNGAPPGQALQPRGMPCGSHRGHQGNRHICKKKTKKQPSEAAEKQHTHVDHHGTPGGKICGRLLLRGAAQKSRSNQAACRSRTAGRQFDSIASCNNMQGCERLLCSLSRSSRALLRSHAGAHTAEWLRAFPIDEGTQLLPLDMQVALNRCPLAAAVGEVCSYDVVSQLSQDAAETCMR